MGAGELPQSFKKWPNPSHQKSVSTFRVPAPNFYFLPRKFLVPPIIT